MLLFPFSRRRRLSRIGETQPLCAVPFAAITDYLRGADDPPRSNRIGPIPRPLDECPRLSLQLWGVAVNDLPCLKWQVV